MCYKIEVFASVAKTSNKFQVPRRISSHKGFKVREEEVEEVVVEVVE